MTKNQKGFSLIELLVVIAIIAILSTLAVISLNNARQKSRDAKRVSDIKQIQSALELYFNDAGTYPETVSSTSPIVYGNNTYMAKVPVDPITNADYGYTRDSATSYHINFTLEGQSGTLQAGNRVATPAGIE